MMEEKIKVLLLDDNPDDRVLVIRELNKEYTLDVEQIINNKSFTRVLDKGGFDIVITDYQLRWSNGLDILKKIKSRCPDCPVIMFTSTGNEEIAVEAMKSGLDDYILKSPKHFIRLPASVHYVLQKSKDKINLKRTEDELRKSEKKYRELADLLPQIVFEINEKGDFTFVNQAAFALFGYTKDEINTGMNIMQMIAPQDRDRAKDNMDMIMRGEKIDGLEYSALRKNGSKFPVISYSSPVIHESNPAGLRGIVLDITERKIAEEALIKKNRDLETFNKLAVGRELRMIELKKEINDLLIESGKEPRYKTDGGDI